MLSNRARYGQFALRSIEFLCKLTACLPFLTLIFLYLFSWRGAVLIGHWPRPSLDDPKYIGVHDVLYQGLDSIICYSQDQYLGLLPLTGISLLFLAPLMTIAWLNRSPMRKWIWLAIYFLGIVALIADPGSRMAWYID